MDGKSRKASMRNKKLIDKIKGRLPTGKWGSREQVERQSKTPGEVVTEYAGDRGRSP